MPSLFWSGKLTLPMTLLVDANNVLAFLIGKSNDIRGMKDRVKLGYEGAFSDHVHQYDQFGYHYQDRAARVQLEGLSFQGLSVLDVGCGTGALAQVASEQGARAMACGDISRFMLDAAQQKIQSEQNDRAFTQLDAESLPYQDNAFDAVISGMTFGLLPNQEKAIAEMIRVTKCGGLVCVGAHGPEHYWEAIDACLRCVTKRYIIGYRLEWWPRSESYIHGLLEQAKLEEIHSKRVVWRNELANGAAAYDFFAAISASWWYAKFPPNAIEKDSIKTRNYFEQKNINIITDDIIVAYGRKPLSDNAT